MNPAIDEAFREMREDGEKGRIESELAAAKKRIAKLERALRWYAKESNYWPRTEPATGRKVDELVLVDFGERARRALGKKVK